MAARMFFRDMCRPWTWASNCQPLKVLTATARDIQEELTARRITSVEVVDKERQNGKIRGPLHGISVLLKDNIATHPDFGMDTTAGSLALAGSMPRKNADVVEKLILAGAIILGKTHLSELNGFKGSKIMPGWFAVGGQAQSAYTFGDVDLSDAPLGHTCGILPVALGTDTGGSLMTPSTRAALYALRPTSGLGSRAGAVPLSAIFDTVGPMAISFTDLADLLEVLVGPELIGSKGPYAGALTKTFRDLRIGVLRPEEWFWAGVTKTGISDTNAAYVKLKHLAKSFKEVTLATPDAFIVNQTDSFYAIQTARFKATLEEYLQTLETSKVRTLDQLISFNPDHASHEMPAGYDNQDQLIAAAESEISEYEHSYLLRHARRVSRDLGIDKTLRDYNVDVIIAPADSCFNLLVSAAGYPFATMPLSFLAFNGRPIGLAVFSTAHQERLLLQVLSAWEAISPQRRPPTLS
ncbi:related to glu/asp-tRNA amidotransferase subunit A [Rhynchosporium agropyri]|uniref:Related to glu/asp-tRNA amidotransferase subunit A n=1 Tax=Rhynchosporium agropyri TaxID=914238 RepID=A0A1E1KGI9_9HELO|nr:related to glu/asp-tRNA amidotransferase subunit A [Rhynchosporium agropyri]